MGELGVPHKLIRLCRACLEGAKSRVKIDGEYSQAFHVNRSLKQGDALSPVLFNLALEKAIRTASVKAEIFGLGGPKLMLAYADDIGDGQAT